MLEQIIVSNYLKEEKLALFAEYNQICKNIFLDEEGLFWN
jgi:hypothetical protein